MARGDFNLYGGQDPRELPSYSFAEASQYLRIPLATLQSWFVGTTYPIKRGRQFFKPLIAVADRKTPSLSFINLVEAHVLDAIRRDHRVPLQAVRKALYYLKNHFPSKHPLTDQSFETDGLDLFIRKYGQLISASQAGQHEMKEMVRAYLHRVERDSSGVPIRLYPFTRKRQPDEPMAVVIDPGLSFGRPVLSHTSIATAVVAERYKAGESISELADDYDRQSQEIEEAIRCELQVDAA